MAIGSLNDLLDLMAGLPPSVVNRQLNAYSQAFQQAQVQQGHLQSCLGQQQMANTYTHGTNAASNLTTASGSKISFYNSNTSSGTAVGTSACYYGNSITDAWGDSVNSVTVKEYYRRSRDALQERVAKLSDQLRQKWLKLRPGHRVILPDDSEIVVDASGNYAIMDQNAKVTYQANSIRNFNKYLNASDLLEEFFDYLATQGVTKRTLDQVNIKLFVAFLIVRAAEADQEAVDHEAKKLLEDLTGLANGSPPTTGVVPQAASPILTAKARPSSWWAGLFSIAMYGLRRRRELRPVHHFGKFEWRPA